MRALTSIVNTIIRLVFGSVLRIVTSLVLFVATSYISFLMLTRGREWVFGQIVGFLHGHGIAW